MTLELNERITVSPRINDGHIAPVVSRHSLKMLKKSAANLKKGLASSAIDLSELNRFKRPENTQPK